MNLIERSVSGKMLFEVVIKSLPQVDGTSVFDRFFSYNGQSYEDHPSSVYDHYRSSLGNIGNMVITVGSWSSGNVQVESFDITRNIWTTKEPYPYCSEAKS